MKPNKRAKDLMYLSKVVWDFRKEIEQHWATPDPLNSLRYAFTECGEAMDEYLRMNRPGDSRNNERERSYEEELADVAIMLFTAINPEWLRDYYEEYNIEYIWFDVIFPENYRLETLCTHVSEAMMSAKNDEDGESQVYLGWVFRAGLAIGWLYGNPDFDLELQIKTKLEKIAAKHFPDFGYGNPAAIAFVKKAMPWATERRIGKENG